MAQAYRSALWAAQRAKPGWSSYAQIRSLCEPGGHTWPGRLEAESRHGLVPVLILGCQKDGPLLNSDGGEVRAAQVGWIALRRILAPPVGVLSALAKP